MSPGLLWFRLEPHSHHGVSVGRSVRHDESVDGRDAFIAAVTDCIHVCIASSAANALALKSGAQP
jgi:hypothetical protein